MKEYYVHHCVSKNVFKMPSTEFNFTKWNVYIIYRKEIVKKENLIIPLRLDPKNIWPLHYCQLDLTLATGHWVIHVDKVNHLFLVGRDQYEPTSFL
jgi:hypothetical protein